MSARGGCKPVPLQGGEVVLAEEGYLRDSILLPAKQIVGGYTNDMPSFQGRMSEEQLLELVGYIKSLGSKRRRRRPADETSKIQDPEKLQAPNLKQRPGNFGIGICRAGVIKTPSSALDLDLGSWSFSGSWMLNLLDR